MKKIVFYNDAGVFGGHEKMFLKLLSFILKDTAKKISVVYCRDNWKLSDELKKMSDSIELIPISYSSEGLTFIKPFYSLIALHSITQLFKKLDPCCFICIQGDISISILGVLAARRLGAYVVSYLPMAHSRVERKERFGRCKDLLLSYYYGLPDCFITICSSVERDLHERGAHQAVLIVENSLDFDKSKNNEGSKELTDTEVKYFVGVFGRIEFKQKGQNCLIQMIDERQESFKEWKFLIVGDGPDESKMLSLIKERKLESVISWMPWQEDMASLYERIDILVMPSLYEGLPITLLEAMYYKVKILGSQINAFQDVLPAEWLFALGDGVDFERKIFRMIKDSSCGILNKNKNIVVSEYSQKNQRTQWFHCLAKIETLIYKKSSMNK